MSSSTPNSACSNVRGGTQEPQRLRSLTPKQSLRVQGEGLPSTSPKMERQRRADLPQQTGSGAAKTWWAAVGVGETPEEVGAGLSLESQNIPGPSGLPHMDMPGTSPQRSQTNFLQQSQFSTGLPRSLCLSWGPSDPSRDNHRSAGGRTLDHSHLTG